MNVKELKEAIKDLPDDMEVVVNSDEGTANIYSHTTDLVFWNDELFDLDWLPDPDKEEDCLYTREDIRQIENALKCFTLQVYF